jgi:hypothetical protein
MFWVLDSVGEARRKGDKPLEVLLSEDVAVSNGAGIFGQFHATINIDNQTTLVVRRDSLVPPGAKLALLLVSGEHGTIPELRVTVNNTSVEETVTIFVPEVRVLRHIVVEVFIVLCAFSGHV